MSEPATSELEGARRRAIPPFAVAALVFGLAAVLVYGEIWRAGARSHVPVRETLLLRGASRADVIFETWLVSRNAKTLVTAPHRLFDAPHCAPTKKPLALGIPMIALGALAIPPFFVTGDPVLTYNLVLVLLSLLGAAAMYALVVSWTGVPAAGIVAGLLFGFHPTRLFDITHPSVWDTTWIVLGLFFAERLFARGRWRDALGLSAAIALQVGASFYSLVAAVCVATPFGSWLLARDRLRHVSVAQIALVLACTGLAVYALLGPYLEIQTGHGGGLQRSRFKYASPAMFAPGGALFPGVSALALAIFALAARRQWLGLRIQGDPRWLLAVGGLLALWLCLGDAAHPLPNLHSFLASFAPGLDAVRVLLRVASGSHLVVALLAGLGAAALLGRSRRWAIALAALLVLVCGFDVMRAPSLGFERTYRWRLEPVEPDPADRAFFEELAALGNEGPLLEPPVGLFMTKKWLGPPRIMSSLFHGRRTSACFGSYPPAGIQQLDRITGRLPDAAAVDALGKLGFTTVVFRWGGEGETRTRLLERVSRGAERSARKGAHVEHLLTSHGRSAFALRAFVPPRVR